MTAAKSPLTSEYLVTVKENCSAYVVRAHGTTVSCTTGARQAVERLAEKLWGEGAHSVCEQPSGGWLIRRGTTPYASIVAAAAQMEEIVSGYLHDYEFDDGESCHHTPNETEQLLINDAVHGLLADEAFLDALVAWRLLVKRSQGSIEPQLLTALRHARTWIEDAQEQLQRGDRVDTSDSLHLALPPVIAAIETAEARHVR